MIIDRIKCAGLTVWLKLKALMQFMFIVGFLSIFLYGGFVWFMFSMGRR